MRISIACIMSVGVIASSPLFAQSAADALCPSPGDRTRVAAVYGDGPAPMTFAAAPQLKLSEAQVAAGMPPGMSVGVAGEHFADVWSSLAGWDHALVLIIKAGNVFEISSDIVAGEPSSKSKYFNLGHANFSGHLRPDLLGAIYAVRLKGREGTVRGVQFFDQAGEGVFAVFLRGEGEEPDEAAIAQFDLTWNRIAEMPRLCATGP
ncbi:MAG: ChuX/HutX family heme-like substrate-binding protein [Steroidobacteraceae bacterium]